MKVGRVLAIPRPQVAVPIIVRSTELRFKIKIPTYLSNACKPSRTKSDLRGKFSFSRVSQISLFKTSLLTLTSAGFLGSQCCRASVANSLWPSRSSTVGRPDAAFDPELALLLTLLVGGIAAAEGVVGSRARCRIKKLSMRRAAA